jgi:hypothetical protein
MKDPTSNKTVYLIDASLLKKSDCLRKVNFIHNDGLTTSLSNFIMDFGTAFHKFVALYNQGIDPQIAMAEGAKFFLEKCLNVPEDDWRTIDHLMMTMKTYINGPFNRDIDILKPKYLNGKPCVEMQFAFPYSSTPTYDIMLTGTCDMLGVYIDGREVINDYKVTSVYKQNTYLASYDLDPQLIFYSWVLKKYKITDTYLPGMITGIFIKKPTASKYVKGKRVAVTGWNGCDPQRSSLIEFSDKQIEEFEIWLKNKINDIIQAHEFNEWLPNFNCCNDIYGACQFAPLCKEYNKDIYELKKKSMYCIKQYDPSQFQK